MDRNNLVGLVLITLIVTAWLIWSSMNTPEPKKQTDTRKDDTAFVAETPTETSKDTLTEDTGKSKSIAATNKENYGDALGAHATGTREVITIETDLVIAKLSSKGADLIHWELKEYKKWDGVPTQLIADKEGELFLDFWSTGNRRIDSRNLYFKFDNEEDSYRITGEQKLTLKAVLDLGDGRELAKYFTFHGDQYIIDADVELKNMNELVPRGYNFSWTGGVTYQEKNSVDESGSAVAMVSLNGEVEEIDASGEEVSLSPDGLIDFTAVKSKYFGAAIIPLPERQFDGIVDLYGTSRTIRRSPAIMDATVESYDMSFRIPYKNSVQKNSFRVFIGPLDYDIVESYGLENTIDLGWEFLIRPIGEYFMLPIFMFIHNYVPNYGIAIIIFSLIIKLLVYPLSIKQMQSAQKMKLLGPEIQKLRDKYPDDNQKVQQETMKLYSSYGVNPAGGCLPLLLQMPILYALWTILRSTIDLRQAPFAFWINDLSVPDAIITLGFKLPLLGMNQFSGLALLMGLTMFIQQKMTITDPRQKAMIYMMPVMFTLIFSNFPAGLNLYYFFFNLWSIAHQYYINNLSKNKVTLEEMRKSPKKEGWLQKKMREAQDMAAQQGRSVPGRKYDDSQSKGTQPKQKKQQKRTSPTQGKKKK